MCRKEISYELQIKTSTFPWVQFLKEHVNNIYVYVYVNVYVNNI